MTIVKPRNPSRVRWRRLAFGVFAVLVLLFAVQRILDPQPRYQGRTVESWLAQVFDRNRSQSEALRALKAMGRDAVPYEIEVLGRRDSTWRRKLSGMRAKAPTFVARILPDSANADILRSAAQLALLNNPHTGQFAPQIARLLDDTNDLVRLHAMAVVSNIASGLDRSAFPAVRRLLKDPDHRMRLLSASTLSWMGASAQDAIPELEEALEDTNFELRLFVARALLRIRGTNIADGPVKRRVDQILLEAAQREPSHVTNR